MSDITFKHHDPNVMLELWHVTKRFGGLTAVGDVSFKIKKGEIYALIGPNGAGKTTAFNTITGVYEPTNGQASFMGEPIVRNHPQGKMKQNYKGKEAGKFVQMPVLDPTPDRITKLGMARTFQNIRLFSELTVLENVKIAFHYHVKYGILESVFRIGRYFKEEEAIEEEAHSLLKIFHLDDKADEVAKNLPYGAQRRLEIARALAAKPKLLLLDEPAAGMNPQETQELAEYIKEIRDRHHLTVFLIEHHMDLVMKISDYIYVIDFGSKIAEGIPQEVQNNQHVIDAYLGVVEDE